MKFKFARTAMLLLAGALMSNVLYVSRHRFPKSLHPSRGENTRDTIQLPTHVRTNDTDGGDGAPVACIVITFMQSTDSKKRQADTTTSEMYKSLPGIVALMAITPTSPVYAVEVWLAAGHARHTIVNQTDTNIHGTPLIRSLFEQAENQCPSQVAFVGYANADILFDEGLPMTLRRLRVWPPSAQRGLLLVGRRGNVDMSMLPERPQLSHIMNANSEPFMDWAQDYFITTRRMFDWARMPPFVIGRRAYDNALTDWGYHHAVLVDGTNTVKAVHQTLADGNFAGQSHTHPDKEYNAVLPGAVWDHGSLTHATHRTVYSKGTIGIEEVSSGEIWLAADEDNMRYIGLFSDFASIPDPAIAVFGNDGYIPLMLNLLCNLRNFPAMLSHLLMVVPDEQTAQTLLATGLRFTVGISSFDSARGRHDYSSSEYRDILVWRSQTLLTLLGRHKRVLCMEADVIIYQDLLDQPEISSASSDLSLFRDHSVYGAGFLMFAPTVAAKSFYKAILGILISRRDMDNEAITNLIATTHMAINISKFDRCKYRSGASFKYPEEYKDCTDRPIVQQLNWVIGIPAKIALAKAHMGWFLTTNDDDARCASRDIRAVILTKDRPFSLSRLLTSIWATDDNMVIDIHVSVDVGPDGIPDRQVMEVIANARVRWGERGFFTSRVWPSQMGIFGNWVNAWEAELYEASLYKAVVLLEDDLEVSPYFARWFVGAHAVYASLDARVGSVTGQRAQLVARDGGKNWDTLGDNTHAFAYRLMATWSHSPTHANWVAFREWVNIHKTDPLFKPYVNGILPTVWYREYESKGTEDSMWEMWYLKFCELHNCYTVYPWVAKGSKTIVCNWRERGMHYDGTDTRQCDFPLSDAWEPQLLRQIPLTLYDWDLTVMEHVKERTFRRFFPGLLVKEMRATCREQTTCRIMASDNYEELLESEETERTKHQNTTIELTGAWIHQDGHVSQCRGSTISSGSCFDQVPPPEWSCDPGLPLHEKVVVVTHHWGEGYFHFFIESLPRLAQFAEEYPDLKPVVRVHIPENGGASHAAEMVALLGFPHTVSGMIRADRVWIPPPTPCGGHVYGSHTSRLRTMLRHAIGNPPPLSNRLVIVRRKGNRRSIANHDELHKSLSTHWDVVVHTGDGSFSKQLQVFATASVLVGPHGAGLSNMIAMQAGGKVFEFLPVKGGLNVCYTVLAVNLGLQYYTYYEPTSDTESSWRVNVDEVVRILRSNVQYPPLVYFFESSTGELPTYASEILRSSSLRHAAETVLITNIEKLPSDLKVRKVDIGAPDTDLQRFRAVYKPWGPQEPWEQHNFERFFHLRQFLKQENIDAAFYMDSDVLLMDTLPSIDSACDALVDLEVNDPRMQASSMYWAVWAGTAFLGRAVLDDFIQFTLAVYSSDAGIALLERKRAEAPYVCDMTLWYLFVGKAERAAQWGLDVSALPETKKWHFCDSQSMGFDHQHGHMRDGGKGLRSIHFQGGTKADISGIIRSKLLTHEG